MKIGKRTKYKDKHGRRICYGDIIHIKEYPDKYVGGAYDYEGVVEFDENWRQTVVVYYDMSMIGDSVPLCRFPVNGREILRRADDGRE